MTVSMQVRCMLHALSACIWGLVNWIYGHITIHGVCTFRSRLQDIQSRYNLLQRTRLDPTCVQAQLHLAFLINSSFTRIHIR